MTKKVVDDDRKVVNDDVDLVDKADEKKKDHLREAKKLYSKWKKNTTTAKMTVNKKKHSKSRPIKDEEVPDNAERWRRDRDRQ